MTKRDELLALAERCEKASEGSRELDGDIAAALSLQPQGWRRGASEASANAVWFDDFYNWRAPDFTTSLDAVMTLVPEGMSAKLWLHGDESYADVYRIGPYLDGDRKVVFGPFDGQAATAPLALLAAILRARQAMQMEASS